MDDFFAGWLSELDAGLGAMSEDECSRLFSRCAERCSRDALKYLYRDLFDRCGGDLDAFFSRVGEKNGVEGRIVETGRVYELIFTSCDCPLHTRAGMRSPKLCECSKQSMLCVFGDLLPGRNFTLERMETILGGSGACRFRICVGEKL